MNCPNCNSQLLEGTTVCQYCGSNIEQTQPQIQNTIGVENNVVTDSNMNNNQKKNNSKIIIIVLSVVLFIALAFIVYKVMTPSKSTDKPESGNPTEESDAFLMPIEDTFYSNDLGGTVVNGRVKRGQVKPGDTIQIIGLDHKIIDAEIKRIGAREQQEVEVAKAGDNAGLVLKDVDRNSVERGQVAAAPGSIKAYKKFEAKIDMLKSSEGGRSTPFYDKYKPQFYFYTTDITGEVTLDKDEKVSPGDKDVKITVELTKDTAMEVGTSFAIREAGKTIARGTVTKMY